MSALYKGRHRIVEVYRGMSKKAKAGTVAAVMAVGIAGFAGTSFADTTTTTQVTTAFVFPADTTPGSVLSVESGSPVPANGTAVTFDLQQFIQNASVVVNNNNGIADTGSTLAGDIEANVAGLETYAPWNVQANQGGTTGIANVSGVLVSGGVIPAADFSNLPVNTGTVSTPSYQLAASDTTLTLYVVGSSATTFEVSPTLNGSPLSFTDFEKIDASRQSSVTWGETVTTPVVTPTGSAPWVSHGQNVWTNATRAEVAWTENGNWPDPNNKCEEVWITGLGFGDNNGSTTDPGTAHVGFTCDHSGTNVNYGYLEGLTPGHEYAMRIVPATGTYGNHTPIAGAAVGYVDVFTTR